MKNKANRFRLRNIFVLIILISIILTISQVAGFADTPRSKRATDSITNSVNSFPDKKEYNDGVYYGILGKSGAATRIIVEPELSKYVEVTRNTGTSIPSSTYYYSQDGYSGNLPRTSYENNPIYKDMGHYEETTETRFFQKEHDNTATLHHEANGNEYTTFSWDNSNYHPTYHVDEDGFVGDIPKVGEGVLIEGPNRTDYPDGSYIVVSVYRGYYEGNLTKTVQTWVPDWRWTDDYIGYYGGNVT